MAYSLYCPNCNRNVRIKDKWTAGSIVILIILLLCCIWPGIIYLVYKAVKEDRCPSCGMPARVMSNYRGPGMCVPQYPVNGVQASPAGRRQCPICGISSSGAYCSKCGLNLK